jgi:type IV secretory pathway VirB2 component (pilin)
VLAYDTPVPIPDLERAKTALSQQIALVGEKRDEVVATFNGFVLAIENVFVQQADAAGAIALYLIQKHLDDARAALGQILEIARKLVTEGTPVLSLIDKSIEWLVEVLPVVSDVANELARPDNPDFVRWEGFAKDFYGVKAGLQQAAVGETVENVKSLSGWLYIVASANIAYALELLKILADLILSITKITAKAGSVVGIAFAVNELADVIKGAVSAGIAVLSAVVMGFTATIGDIRGMLAQRLDVSDYENGGWPQVRYT